MKLFKKEEPSLRILIVQEDQHISRNCVAFYVRRLRAIFLTGRVNRYNIEFVLEHETIHHALFEVGEDRASIKFDHLVELRWVRKNDVI